MLNLCEQKTLVSLHSELKQNYVPQINKKHTLNEQFLSELTYDRNIPHKEQSSFPDLNISTAGVEKQLLSLNAIKACRSDELPPRLLGTVAQELAPDLMNYHPDY